MKAVTQFARTSKTSAPKTEGARALRARRTDDALAVDLDAPMGAYLWSMLLRAPGSLEQMENA